MNRPFRIILSLSFLFLSAFPVFSQTRAETRQYGKTVAAGDVKSFDKFLKKYPDSVYAPDILARKDTLLNITPYSLFDAEGIAGPFAGENALFKAVPSRKDAVDRIDVIAVRADSLKTGEFRVMTLLKDNRDSWNMESCYDRIVFDDEEISSVEFVDTSFVASISHSTCLFFNCLLSSGNGLHQDYLAVAYFPARDVISTELFSGKNILGKDESGYRILGRMEQADAVSAPEKNLLRKMISDNTRLEKVSDADYYTDQAIEFWLNNNPEALTTAKSIKASAIPEGSSLIDSYKAAKGKQSSSKYTAAMFDLRGYTIIVVYAKSSGEYILAWVEPECKDHNRDRLLNSIEFEDANSLEMFYYQGRRYFKYHYNLTSKTLRR